MSARPVEAVILAAGRGNRISAAAQGVPKPLLPLDGPGGERCFLDWHLACLSAAGVERVWLVGNGATCGVTTPLMAGRRVEWLLNPSEDLTTSGSAHSASIAWERVLDGTRRVLLMDADIVYAPDLLARLVASPAGRSKVAVHPEFRDTDEEVLVFAEGDRPVLLGKGLLGTPFVEGLCVLGEATGMVLFEPEDHATLRAVTDWTLRFSTVKQRAEHEDLTQAMMRLGRMEAFVCEREELFMEVDTPDEYEVLVSRVAPVLPWPQSAGLGRP